MDSAEACCESCTMTKGCNAWVYCPEAVGCGGGEQPRPKGECWLKKADIQELLENVVGKGHSGISWTSGSLYSVEEEEAFKLKVKAKAEKEAARRKALKDDPDLPLVSLDVLRACFCVVFNSYEAMMLLEHDDSPLRTTASKS